MRDRSHDYVLDEMSPSERLDFELAMIKDPSLKKEVMDYELVQKLLILELAVPPPPRLRQLTLDALGIEALRKPTDRPKILHQGSCEKDYEPWLSLPEMVPPEDLGELFFIPFAENEEGLSAIVWIPGNGMVPEEVHHDCVERFLVLEGSCDISFGGEKYALQVGDVLHVPLHHPHKVQVTSATVCKLIVQRTAA